MTTKDIRDAAGQIKLGTAEADNTLADLVIAISELIDDQQRGPTDAAKGRDPSDHLPADMADAYENYKLTMARHAYKGWRYVSPGDAIAALRLLIDQAAGTREEEPVTMLIVSFRASLLHPSDVAAGSVRMPCSRCGRDVNVSPTSQQALAGDSRIITHGEMLPIETPQLVCPQCLTTAEMEEMEVTLLAGQVEEVGRHFATNQRN